MTFWSRNVSANFPMKTFCPRWETKCDIEIGFCVFFLSHFIFPEQSLEASKYAKFNGIGMQFGFPIRSQWIYRLRWILSNCWCWTIEGTWWIAMRSTYSIERATKSVGIGSVFSAGVQRQAIGWNRPSFCQQRFLDFIATGMILKKEIWTKAIVLQYSFILPELVDQVHGCCAYKPKRCWE